MSSSQNVRSWNASNFLVVSVLFLVFLFVSFSAAHAEQEVRVLGLTIDGPITPASAELLDDSLHTAIEDDMDILLVSLDTPGGMVVSMRTMIRSMLNARVPVVIWVGPSGGQAASAGTFLVAASHFAGMAPQTTIGSATPVGMQGEELDDAMQRKVNNELISLVTSAASSRGRNAAWYKLAVTDAVNLSAEQAVLDKVVETMAVSPEDLLDQAVSRGIPFSGAFLRFDDPSITIRPFEPSLRHAFLSWLLHPQIAYLLFLAGMVGLFFELSTPGAILPGVIGGFSLILGLYALSVLPFNVAGLLLLLFGGVLFLLEIKITSFGMLGLGGLISLTVGSLLLFRSPDGSLALPYVTIFTTSLVVAAALGFLVYLVRKAHVRRPSTGAQALVGMLGTVQSWEGHSGVLRLRGELWRARSEVPIAPAQGGQLRITAVDGLTVLVESSDSDQT